MNTVIEHIVNAIKAGNLTFEERLAVVQDVGIIKKYYKSDKIDLLNGLTKIQEKLPVTESKDLPSHAAKFNNYVATSVKVLREELAEKLMKPIFEAELEKGESESDSDFKKREDEQEKIQSKNVDEFEKAQEKMKKGESKPLAKALRSKGMSQQELADQLDVHKSTISRIKTGKRNPSFEMMTELGDALGSVENLFPELK